MRRIVAIMPEDLGEHVDEEYLLGEGGDNLEQFSMKLKDKEMLSLLLTSDSIENITWMGAQVLLKDILMFQRSRFLLPDHQLLCLGSGVTLCGIWAALTGTSVVLTDFPDKIDSIWANIAANADEIRRAGGSCGARHLDFKNFEMEMAMVVGEMELNGELTVLASDAMFNAKDLSTMVQCIFEVRSDARFYIVVHHDHVFQEFFKNLTAKVEFLQVYGDLEYRIIKGEAK